MYTLQAIFIPGTSAPVGAEMAGGGMSKPLVLLLENKKIPKLIMMNY